MKPFDPTKPVQTRDGRPARIICTDRKDKDYPIVALIELTTGVEVAHLFTADGHFIGRPTRRRAHSSDLINITGKHSGWVNVFVGTGDKPFVGEKIYASEAAAKESGECTLENYRTTTRIDWED